MPFKFKETTKILVDRQAKKYRTQNFYMHATTTDQLLEAFNSSSTRGPRKQKIRNELVKRNAI